AARLRGLTPWQLTQHPSRTVGVRPHFANALGWWFLGSDPETANVWRADSVWGSDPYGQRAEPAQVEVVVVLDGGRVDRELDLREAADHLLEADLAFEAGEAGAEAEMGAVAE